MARKWNCFVGGIQGMWVSSKQSCKPTQHTQCLSATKERTVGHQSGCSGFGSSVEYEIMTTPISQPLNELAIDEKLESDEWEVMIEALPWFEELSFDCSIDSELICQQLSTAFKLSSRLKKLKFSSCSGPLVLKLCEELGCFGNLQSIDISFVDGGVGDALCEILGQNIESSQFVPSVTLNWNRISDKGCAALLKGIEGRARRIDIDEALLDIDLSYNEIGVSGLLAILKFFQAGFSAGFALKSNNILWYYGEQNLLEMTSKYVERGYLQLTLTGIARAESICKHCKIGQCQAGLHQSRFFSHDLRFPSTMLRSLCH
eukprot:TRINITY_DN23533_c0_g1_i3.p1 TRINITY_DN23533_c0_g1~~TRINITY_DN23533_c0_g1_i3.p1  ORF type:complete len:317 (-),score=51.45 TRINITY_DN23533_c0_g1_i3:61-1011(-)